VIISAPVPTSANSTDRWENEGGPASPAKSDSEDIEAAALKQYGITSVQQTVFHWGGYRYSNARDAIAAAKRSAHLSDARTDLR
jgi:hypothetical protein